MPHQRKRYILLIKTQPHTGYFPPQGWEWDSLADAREGARRADRLWLAVRLLDTTTDTRVAY